jgi:ABC-type phosphate/phosphonate transport system substrate-binding protein
MGTLLLGAVAYDPKVVTIWEGFRTWLRSRDLDFDFVLYSHYERQVDDLMAGRIAVAWNSPLAWVRARRIAEATGVAVSAVAMRDTDRDLTSAIVVRSDSPFTRLADLTGRTVAVGAVDSPQATLLPLSLLRSAGVADATVRRFDVGVGLHGDHIGGEREAAVALRDGQVDAACMIDGNVLLFGQEGTLPADSVRVIGQTEPYDHCNMTVGPGADPALVDPFVKLLLDMSYADAEVRPLLDLEGLKQWLPGRLEGYAALERAVDEVGFYGQDGSVDAVDHRP